MTTPTTGCETSTYTSCNATPTMTSCDDNTPCNEYNGISDACGRGNLDNTHQLDVTEMAELAAEESGCGLSEAVLPGVCWGQRLSEECPAKEEEEEESVQSEEEGVEEVTEDGQLSLERYVHGGGCLRT